MKVKFLKKEYEITSPWEDAFERFFDPFRGFIHKQSTTGLILLFMTVLALYLANSSFADDYAHIFHTYFTISIGDYALSYSLHHWINDGLMAIFFFVVGLEIKREVLVGELSDPKNVVLPIVAAIGGMVFPALIYYSFNMGTEGASGWGIPMATDIAFAISALVLLGKRIPTALVTFLVALAIVDDLGAVTVIALFYTEQLEMTYLALAFGIFGLMIVFNRLGIHTPVPYFILGAFMWWAMLHSGVHATIAGVLAALAIPAKPKFNPDYFQEHMKTLVSKYESFETKHKDYQLHDAQESVVKEIETVAKRVQPPLRRLEDGLHLPVSLLIIPIFALANAGVAINFSEVGGLVLEPVALGIILGLILGKVIGIFGVSWVAIKLGIARLPSGSTMSQVFGVSFFGGIGFTMSIFIANLAWPPGSDLLDQAKTAILIASLLAVILGYVWLRFVAKSAEKTA